MVPIPGASAVLAVVAASAVAGPRWSFEGFLPRSGRERRERIARIAADERGTVIYEAPGRVAATLVDLAAACGADRPAAIGRELTKLHEEIVRGSLGELARRARSGELTLRGEFALVVGAWPAARIEVESASGAADASRRWPARPTRKRPRWPRSSGASRPAPHAGTPPGPWPRRPGSRAASSTAWPDGDRERSHGRARDRRRRAAR